MSVDRMPKQIFYSELSSGARSRGGQRMRYKDNLKQTLKLTGNNTETWREIAEHRTAWRQAVKKGVRSFEAEQRNTQEDKRHNSKAKEALDIGPIQGYPKEYPPIETSILLRCLNGS